MPQKEVSRLQAEQSMIAGLQTKFKEAAAAYQQGRLADVERIYEDVLRRYPNHFDALHGLAIIAAQTGRPERAVELFRKAIKLNSKVASTHRNLGIALKELKRSNNALLSFDKAIALKPDYAECHNSRGLALQDLKRPAEALVAHEKAIALKPQFPEAHYNRGIALMELKRPVEALAAHEKAIELNPFFPEAYYNRGVVLELLMRPADALLSYERAIALRSSFAEAHSSRGNILQEQRHLEEALTSHDRAIALKPDFAEGYNNRGNALMYLMRPTEALASCDKAIALKPDFAEAYNNRGNILQDLGRHEEAVMAFDKAIALKPDYVEASSNKSHLLLLMGRLEEGWRLYEARKRLPSPIAADSYVQPLWLGGQDIAGKVLLLRWEQGFGDTIQFCRYAKAAEAKGAKVLLSVQETLQELMRTLSPTIEIVQSSKDPIHFDYHCPLMSLPLALGTTLATIPAEPRYLVADSTLRAIWEARLPPKTKPRIGVVWSGSTIHKIYNRSMSLEIFRALLDSDAEWVCLQKEVSTDDIATLGQDSRINFFGDDIRNFSDTAALLDLTDLVVTIDTSIAHLAGAMGKPVWVLLPYNANWRWLLNRSDSPWYPSARLFRQGELANWSRLIAEVKSELEAFMQSKTGCNAAQRLAY
jgi:tetratricopeptide (TPR) repeat protein